MAFWDRIKFLLLLGLLWLAGLAVVWTTTVKPLGGPFDDALRIALRTTTPGCSRSWRSSSLRQLHYLLEEHSKGYYRFWQTAVFGARTGGSAG